MNYDFNLYIPYSDIDNRCAIIVDNERMFVYEIVDENLSDNYDIIYFNNYYRIPGIENTNYEISDCYPFITNDFYYSHNFYKSLIIFDNIVFFGLLLPWLIFTQLFKKVR